MWAEARSDIIRGPGSVKCYERRAKAMRYIWNDDTIVKENALWLSENMESRIPPVVAVDKVLVVKTNLSGGHNNLSDLELAELQTCHKINALATNCANAIFQKVCLTMRDIKLTRDIIAAPERGIKARNRAPGGPNKEPVNLERDFVDLRTTRF